MERVRKKIALVIKARGTRADDPEQISGWAEVNIVGNAHVVRARFRNQPDPGVIFAS